jgi:hypothetical protein
MLAKKLIFKTEHDVPENKLKEQNEIFLLVNP